MSEAQLPELTPTVNDLAPEQDDHTPARQLSEWTTNYNDLTLEEGDLIEFDRGLYSHWGLYIGGGEIVHFIPLKERYKMGLLTPDKFIPGLIEKRSLYLVQRQYSPENPASTPQEPSRIRVNNKRKLNKTPRSVMDIHEHIRILMENPKRYKYCLKHFNCEHFVTALKFGEMHSAQMNVVKRTALNVVSPRNLLFGPVITIPMAVIKHFQKKKKLRHTTQDLHRTFQTAISRRRR